MTAPLRLARYTLDGAARELLAKEIRGRLDDQCPLDADTHEAILAGIGAPALQAALPRDLLDALRGFAAADRHALLLRNLPVQDFPPTPVSGFGREDALAFVNTLHFGMIRLLGMIPFAVDYENHGRLLRNVVPNPEAAGTTSSWGADSDFFWHTDNPHLRFGEPGRDPRPYVPRYLTFYAVRNEEQVPTELVALEDVVDRLEQPVIDALRRTDFQLGAPASNDAGSAAGPQQLNKVPILEPGRSGGHLVRYDRGTTRALAQRAEKPLEKWAEALETVPPQEFTLEPGDFLVFDNYRVLHRRRAFTPAAPDHARWLRRCYAS